MVEHRQSLRKPPDRPIDVLDVITGRPIGRVGNLSIDGMLLITQRRAASKRAVSVEFQPAFCQRFRHAPARNRRQ